jgi:predicted DNA-binding transcriptional regulator YafY
LADPLERLTNLVALLLEARVPMTLTEIANELGDQYPESESARRAAFERDKALMRGEGIPLAQTVLSGDRAGQTAYWIDRQQFELGDLGLTTDERQALQLAVAAVHLGTGWADDAIIKLGGTTTAGSAHLGVTIPALANLPPLFDAVAQRRPVHFTYRHEPRSLEPWGLLSRGAFWYVVGRDRDRGEQRTFRVDRIEGSVRAGEAASFTVPAGFDPRRAFPADAKMIGEGDGPTEALVAIDADRARAVVQELGADAVVRRNADQSIVVRVPCANRWVFRSWLLGFVEHAEVLEPIELRDEMLAWLDDLVRRG